MMSFNHLNDLLRSASVSFLLSARVFSGAGANRQRHEEGKKKTKKNQIESAKNHLVFTMAI